MWDGKSKGNRSGYSIFIRVLKTLGIAPAYFLLLFVAAYYFLFSWKTSRPTWYYLRRRQGFSFFKSIILLYKNYYIFGQALIDRVVLMGGIRNQFTFNFDGEVHLHEMVSQGKGGLLISAHLGNWEIAGHLLDRLNTKINIVMFDGEHEKVKQYLTSVTGERKAHIIVVKDDGIAHIYEMMEALNRNELICIHADRFMPGNKTLSQDFLGEEALFPLGPFTLGTKLNVPVSFVFALKETNTHYHFFATPLVNYRSLTPQQMLKDYVAQLELKAKAYPTQWYNYYPFWNK